jgi:hypothetical protein
MNIGYLKQLWSQCKYLLCTPVWTLFESVGKAATRPVSTTFHFVTVAPVTSAAIQTLVIGFSTQPWYQWTFDQSVSS